MALKDEWQVDIDLSCIERYVTDLAKTEPKLRKKIVRSSLKRGNKLLQNAEKTALGDALQAKGKLNRWGIPHSGFLKKGLKGRVSFKNNNIKLIVGVKNLDKERISFHNGRKHLIKAPTYAGVWLNFGTQSHSIANKSSMRHILKNRQKVSSDSYVNGIPGNDWVMSSFNRVKNQLFKATTADPDSNSGTWSPWNGITEIGDIGNSGAFVEQTTLADTTKRYMAGMKDTAEMEVTYYKYAGDTNQAALKTAAEAGSNIWVKVQWKNGDTAKFQAAISGYALVGGSNEDGVKAKISMRINGDVSFTDK